MDTFKKIEDIAKHVDVEPRFAMRSITTQAAKSIYYFPIMCSNSVSPSTAAMMSKNLEHAYMSFVQACFALTPAVKAKGDRLNVEDYLKQFHQNVGIKSANELFLNATLKEATEEYKLFPNEVLNEAVSSAEAAKILSDAKNGIDLRDRFRDNNKPNDKIEKSRFKANRLSTQDVKKPNSMTPSVINVPVTFIFNDEPIDTKIPVGVKTIVHPVDSDELGGQIMDSVAGKGIFHNIIKYTTGEVMSLKDIIFGISKMKKNISKSSKSTVAKWFDIVEHRKRLAKLSMPFLGRKAFLPNLTIHISMDDVNTIQRLIGYNLLTDTARASKFIKDNFLIALVITDDATETAYVLYDGHSDYEEYPYTSIKRDNEKVNDEINAMIKGLGLGIKMN